ncbi:allophanate hydrolase 2 subunit 2 [Vibrio ishigakensis]|uniref:Allophanate hydrolase 2 subunit 2 n=1 Tax=Vibrio ishigakensis TaxID=1481914 RepID=A0A0B8Q3K2_9VIBR|nr:allophanate hydrolase 2 subunit 2 [Vibrio ishigakensis]
MDEHAYHWCNRLLGNDHRDTVLEITFGLLQLEALKPTTIALTGADLGARLNDRKIGPWSTYSIKPGDQLSFEQPISGLRAYLGVKGGFLCSKTLESSSTVSRESIGGLDGKGSPLKAGDEIPFIASSPLAKKQTPEWAIEEYDAPLELGVIQGYQFEHFCKEQVSNFYASPYTISNNIDRMGYRLSGSPIISSRTGIVSEGIAYGAIQLPNDGQPIVLMRDRQTIGGYPKIGCIGGLGASRLAQRAPQQQVQFRPMDISEAEIERRLFYRSVFT